MEGEKEKKYVLKFYLKLLVTTWIFKEGEENLTIIFILFLRT